MFIILKYLTINVIQDTVEIKQKYVKDSFLKLYSFLSYIFPVLEFLSFWRSES